MARHAAMIVHCPGCGRAVWIPARKWSTDCPCGREVNRSNQPVTVAEPYICDRTNALHLMDPKTEKISCTGNGCNARSACTARLQNRLMSPEEASRIHSLVRTAGRPYLHGERHNSGRSGSKPPTMRR
jgi:hypothetical protein